MKIAIVQDELVRKGGAEQVVLSFHAAFPDAPIYTLCYNPETTYAEFKDCNIVTSMFNKFANNDKSLKQYFFPFGVMAMKQLDVTEYDVVLHSTTHCAKYVKVNDKALVISYCHTPFRLAWQPSSYAEVNKSKNFKRILYNIVIRILKNVDYESAQRTDWFVTNSKEVVPRIQAAYNPSKEITIINPPVKCANFYVSNKQMDYYLVVSRFESYKKVDLVVRAFNQMPDKQLLIVGHGSMEEELKRIAHKNITFRKGLNSKELSQTYAECKALIFPQHEDYGITPLEANASGRPVIAYGLGGVKDTMIPYINDSEKATALFFTEQSIECIINAVKRFENLSFDPAFIRAHAEKFDESIFVQRIQSFVKNKYCALNTQLDSTML